MGALGSGEGFVTWALRLDLGSHIASGSGRKVLWGMGTSLGPVRVLKEGGTPWGVRPHDCHRGPMQGVGVESRRTVRSRP